MLDLVLSDEHLLQVCQQVFNCQKQFVSSGCILEMSPKTLNGVEGWAVGRQPKHQQTMFVQTQGGFDRSTAMIGGIVHDENNTACRVTIRHEMLKKFDKSL